MTINTSAPRSHSPFRLAAFASIAVAGLLLMPQAMAQTDKRNAVNTVAKTTRTCVASGPCSVGKTGQAFGAAVRSMDRLGWEIGRSVSMRKHGPAGDPGKYPGIDR